MLFLLQLEKRKVWLDHAVAEYEKSNKRLRETLQRLKRENMMVSPRWDVSVVEKFSRADMIRCVSVLLDSSRGSTSGVMIFQRKREKGTMDAESCLGDEELYEHEMLGLFIPLLYQNHCENAFNRLYSCHCSYRSVDISLSHLRMVEINFVVRSEESAPMWSDK